MKQAMRAAAALAIVLPAACAEAPPTEPQTPVVTVMPVIEPPPHDDGALPPDPDLGKDDHYRLAWAVRTNGWNHGIVVLASGDVLSLSIRQAVVHARHNGATLETAPMCSIRAAALVDAGHVVVACSDELVELSLPGLVERSVVTFDGPARASAVGPAAAVIAVEREVRAYHPRTGALLDKLMVPEPGDPEASGYEHALEALAVSADGKLIAIGDAKGRVFLRAVGGEPPVLIEEGSSRVKALAFSPDARELFVDNGSWKAQVLDVQKKKQLRQYKADSWTTTAVYATPTLIAAAGSDGLQLFSAGVGGSVRLKFTPGSATGEGVGASRDGSMVCTGDRGGLIACFSKKALELSTYTAPRRQAP